MRNVFEGFFAGLLIGGFILVVAASFQATPPAWAMGAVTHELCIDETTASAACDDGTTDITPNLMSQYTEHQVCVRTTSTASAWVCDVYGNMDGYHATIRNQLNTTSMTETAPCVNLVGLLEYVWMECGTITGGNVDSTIKSWN